MQMHKRLKQNVYANVNLMQFDRQSKHNLPNNPVCPPISNEFRNLKCFKGEILNTRLTLIFFSSLTIFLPLTKPNSFVLPIQMEESFFQDFFGKHSLVKSCHFESTFTQITEAG